MPDSAYPTTTADQREPNNAHVPPWISVFILFGALGGLIILFAMACWFARSVLGRAPPINLSREAPPGAVGGESEEVVAQKMRQLDESAPARPYGEYRDEAAEAAEVGAETAKDGAAMQASTRVVCSICLDTLEDSDVVRRLPCRHTYHSECIVKWYMKKHDTCPLCKNYYVPHDDDGAGGVAVPRRALLGMGPGVNARDEAMLRFYQTMSV